jgi:signal peptidase I
MFGFFAPRYVKEGKLFLKNARKFLHYKRDLWSEADVADFENHIAKLDKAIGDRDKTDTEETAQQLDTMVGKFAPPTNDAAWRENCEVFLVAIIIAVGIRTFFLQPFTIPTGSMQPTLNGIIGTSTPAIPLPNIAMRVVDFFLHGRNYIEAVSQTDDVIVAIQEVKRFRFFTCTEIACEKQKFTIWAPVSTLHDHFHLDTMRQYHTGDVIVRGYIDAGDHVFVDKFSYNFRAPHRGDVFVFNTKNIPTQENRYNPDALSQFYIKRLGGTPGDTLRISPPELFVNGELAKEPGFVRVMSAADGYRGYCNFPPTQFRYLTSPEEKFTVPASEYFALGDNSYHSSDSRYFGTVPKQNIMGRGLFVYLPILPHFGLIQ